MLEGDGAAPPSLLVADRSPGPDKISEQREMIGHIRRILEKELTPKQREALVLLGVKQVPLEEAAQQLHTNRNALYKLLHDARLRLKRRLKNEGITTQEVLTAFEHPE
jgi:RNA polymerase sigma-70 factor (ECF subfamily)